MGKLISSAGIAIVSIGFLTPVGIAIYGTLMGYEGTGFGVAFGFILTVLMSIPGIMFILLGNTLSAKEATRSETSGPAPKQNILPHILGGIVIAIVLLFVLYQVAIGIWQSA